ncbi:MAG: glycoside hydrolase family 2 protein [Puniceicoccaceae bacterium]
MYQTIDLSTDWKIFHLDLDEGLLGNAGRAYQHDYAPSDCVTADVPITAPAAWLADGRIGDPYVDMNSRENLWMEQKEWWYLKDFDLPRTDGCYRLNFEGINYRAEAWLNDVQIGVWEGSFLKKSIDLDPELIKSTGNRLAVRVRAQERAWEDGTQPDPRGFQNSSAHIRTQRPTPQYAYGWNWSPHLIAVGIWRPVTLEWMETARFSDTRIHSDVSDDLKTGTIRFTGAVEALAEATDGLSLDIEVTHPGGSTTQKKEAISGSSIDTLLEVPDPALWFPNGFGEQPLYTFVFRLVASDGEILDVRQRRLGFRRVEFIPNTNDIAVQAESGQSNRMWSIVGNPYPWTMVVNGLRIFSKGTNWCPVDNLYRDRDAHITRLLELARDAHYVFIRVWGGGLTESDHFYDCCDEMGLLCLQEFWFACGSAPAMDYGIFLENAESELIRLRERTSIAMWGGGNEFNPDNHENRPIINLIADLVEKVDGTREFRRGSPYKGDRHGGLVSTPYYTTNKYRDLLPGRKRLVLLRSECAVGRSPTRPDHIRKFVPEDKLWPIDWEVYQNHHAQSPEWEMVSQPFGPAKTWEQALLHASVFHCMDSRMNMEFARASKYESSGCWTWQLNASWPSFHREHVDWYGAPKPVYYWYKNACKPVITLADFERFVYHPGEPLNPEIIAVNDTHRPVATVVEMKVYSLDGSLLHEATQSVTIPADDRTSLGQMDYTIPVNLTRKALYLSLTTSVDGAVVHRNTYYIAISPDTVQATAIELGTDMTLHYMGKTEKVSAPHYYTLMEIVDEPTEHDKEQKQASASELDAVYSTRFAVPDHLSGKDLEIFLPGPSADDVVKLNGTVIGEGLIDLENEWNYEADPLRWPNLPNRHYPIPTSLLKAEDNVLEIQLSGQRIASRTDKRFGLTRMFYLREATPVDQQTELAEYNQQMEFFRPIVEGPRAHLGAEVLADASGDGISLRITNSGPASAAFLTLDLTNEGATRFTFDEGAPAALHPDESIEVSLDVEGELSPNAALAIRCLNADALNVPIP